MQPQPIMDSVGDVAIIREIYTDGNSQEAFEMELERALEQACETIVIEPLKLGDETSRWISFGNCLHKTAVLSGFGSVAANLVWPDRPALYTATTLTSLFCTGLYTISWQFDPCCKYQVEHNQNRLQTLLLLHNRLTTSSASHVVLVRTDDSRKKILHWTVTLLAVGLCGWRLYQLYRS